MSVCNFHLIQCFTVCFLQCCQLLQSPSDVVIVGVSGQEIKKRIINTSGPGVTARGVYTSFSSLKRVNTQNVQMYMTELGYVKKVDKLNTFYKKLPEYNITPKLAAYDKLCPYKPTQQISGKGIRN